MKLAYAAGASIAAIFPTIAAAQAPTRVSVTGDIGVLCFDVRCDATPSAVTITLRGAGKDRTYQLDQPCGQWSGSTAAIPNVAPRLISKHALEPDDPSAEPAYVSRVELRATGTQPIRRTYDYTIAIDHTTLARIVQ